MDAPDAEAGVFLRVPELDTRPVGDVTRLPHRFLEAKKASEPSYLEKKLKIRTFFFDRRWPLVHARGDASNLAYPRPEPVKNKIILKSVILLMLQ